MTKKALLYMIAGLLCAGGAVLLARNQLSSDPTTEAGPPTTQVLVASKGIEFGTPIIHIKSDNKNGNAGFAEWPEKFVPEGAITSAKKLKEQQLVATTRFVRHQPILASLVQTRDQFVPDGAFVEYFKFDADEVAGVEAGQRVDILKIDRNQRVEPFIRCAKVYSIGNPPGALSSAGSAEKEYPNRLYVLLPRKIRETVIEAKLKLNLIIRESIHECGPDKLAELVEDTAAIRTQKAAEALQRGKALMESERYEAAVKRFQQVVEDYPELPQANEAREQERKAREAMATDRLKSAQNALAEADYERAIKLSEELRREFSDLDGIVTRSRQISQEAEKELQRIQRQQRYRKLLDALQNDLRMGDLPAVEERLRELEGDFAGIETGPDLESPAEVQKETNKRLQELRTEFKNDYRVLAYHLQANNKTKAVEKLREMERQFSGHPRLEAVRGKMREKGWIE
jgi:tetratricopeptide (TPR) repeat protein